MLYFPGVSYFGVVMSTIGAPHHPAAFLNYFKTILRNTIYCVKFEVNYNLLYSAPLDSITRAWTVSIPRDSEKKIKL